MRQQWNILTAKILILCFMAEMTVPVLPDITAFALPVESTVDYWELMEEAAGEVTIGFPVRIEASLEGAGDRDRFAFALEDTTDLSVRLESEREGALLTLTREGTLCGRSSLPYYDQIIEIDEMPAGRYVLEVNWQDEVRHGGNSDYQLTVTKSLDYDWDGDNPNYSEAHIAGAMFRENSPVYLSTPSDADLGGYTFYLTHYAAHWQGPVKDSVAPYRPEEAWEESPNEYIIYREAEPEFHIQDTIIPPEPGTENWIEHWKNIIMTTGAISTGLGINWNYTDSFWNMDERGDVSFHYFPEELQQVAEEEGVSGHSIAIVGWDDSIPAEAFKITVATGSNAGEYMPERDGAWICRDSYGTGEDTPYWMLSEDGYFYASYDSFELGVWYASEAYGAGEKIDNYNHVYSNSTAGMFPLAFFLETNGQEDLLYSNVFHTGNRGETLRAVGVYMTSPGCSYDILLRIGDEVPRLVKSGYEPYGGFHTLRLDSGIVLPENTEFEVIVSLKMEDGSNGDIGVTAAAAEELGLGVSGVKNKSGFSYIYEGDYRMGTADLSDTERLDISGGQGIYPAILAYTYSPEGSGLSTFLDVRAEEGSASEEEIQEARETLAAAGIVPRSQEASMGTEGIALAAGKATPSDAEEILDGKEPESGGDYVPGEEEILDEPIPDKEAASPEAAEYAGRKIADGMRRASSSSADGPELDVELPSYYNLADEGELTSVKNQGASSLCWAFSGTASMESAFLKSGSNMVNFPRGIAISAESGTMENGVLKVRLSEGEEIPLSFTALLLSDSDYFNPETDQIYWEISGDTDAVEADTVRSKSGESIQVMTAKSSGNLTVTAVSMADQSLKAQIPVKIYEDIPARITLNRTEVDLRAGQTFRLTADVESQEELKVMFSSSDPSVADVDNNGLILALRPGTAAIRVTAGSASAECIVRVSRDSGRGSGGSSNSGSRYPAWTAGEMNQGPGAALDTPGTWEQEANGLWKYRLIDGRYPKNTFVKINGSWYYFDEDGTMAAGWRLVQDFWYYLSEEPESFGKMATGWLYDPSYSGWFYLKESGEMVTGWQSVQGIWYYFQEVSDGNKGKMYQDRRTPDGYLVNSEGQWIS